MIFLARAGNVVQFSPERQVNHINAEAPVPFLFYLFFQLMSPRVDKVFLEGGLVRKSRHFRKIGYIDRWQNDSIDGCGEEWGKIFKL